MENVKNMKVQGSHILHIDNRHKIDITGVTKVITFNEESIVLDTILGGLNIKGKSMKVNKLNVDNGDMSIEGEVISIIYINGESSRKENLFVKLFK